MDFLSHLLPLSGVVIIALIVLYNHRRRSINTDTNTNKGNFAPEPSGAWPIIGHLHLLGEKIPISRILGAMADKLGPVFTLRLGVHRAVVVSSREAVKDCFTTNDRVLAKRPSSTAGIYLGYNHAGFGFAHGPYWREVRKLVLAEVLTPRRLDSLRPVREAELAASLGELHELVRGSDDDQEREVAISERLERLTLDTIMMMLAGKRCAERGGGDAAAEEEAKSLRHIIKQFMYISGQFVVSDSIPFPPLRWLDLQGHIKSMKRIADELSEICEGWIGEHVERRRIDDGGLGIERDFIDVMLSAIDDKFMRFGHTRETIIKATLLNLILAGSDTTSTHMTWILSLLLNNTRAMQQTQAEIDDKVGKDRWVQESDIKNLVYLQAVVKEALRLFPPGPLAVPHEAMEDCRVAGYHVARGTRILVNVWKLHRDPRVWEEPDEFVPERFLTRHADVDFTGHHHEFIPFGSGRRSCPGITFATQVTHLTMARLIQGFEFRTPLDEPVDMTEGLGITLPKATPLRVLVAPRLAPFMYQK
ncbi:nicotine N-demethylase CYP82E3-like [Salvia miltiorrhiza]|uniref:nicotine N-demethylase CYP82E3-like n=1 Tax=Salvia miltiorrhiza TaxID=226208 RepID=UPI0025AB89FC|nr:nicotine N-demethylase CYP82E3-like [Salvia miltiorrhiza]